MSLWRLPGSQRELILKAVSLNTSLLSRLSLPSSPKLNPSA